MIEEQEIKGVDLSNADQEMVKSTRCSLTPKFWNHFIKNIWEKETFVLNDGSVTIPISEDDLFDVVVYMSECQINEFEESDLLCKYIRFYIGDNTVPFTTEYFHLHPKKEDKCFSAYSKRVRRELKGKEFSLVIDYVEIPAELQAWTLDFLKGMYRPLKSVSYGHFWSFFFGDYSTTAFGVHDHKSIIASEAAFYFPITGNKQMRIWHPDYVAENQELQEARDYSEHIEASKLLSVDRGGMMYWPSDRWHIGSSGGGDVSIVLAVKAFEDNLILFYSKVLDGYFDKYLRQSVIVRTGLHKYAIKIYMDIYLRLLRCSKYMKEKQVLGFSFDPDDLLGCAAVIPDEVRRIVKPFTFLFGKNLDRVVSVFWLYYLLSLGLTGTDPKMLEANTYSPDTRIKRGVVGTVLWRQLDTNFIMVMVDKYPFEAPDWFLPVVEYVAATVIEQELCCADLLRALDGVKLDQSEEVLNDFVNLLIHSQVFFELSKTP